MGKYGEIAKLPREVQISYAFAYVFATFAASPAPIMEAAFGRLHKGGRPSAAPLVGSIMGAGEAANVAKTQANAYEICTSLGNFAIFPYFPTVASAAIP